MKRTLFALFLATLAATTALAAPAAKGAKAGAKSPEWSMNATTIEACSCPMFCQCYFNPEPAAHASHAASAEATHEHGAAGGEHFCRFNNAYKVNRGHYKNVKLDGAKFWMYGDLGGDFSQGRMDWVVVTFDQSTTPEQREALATISSHLFPVKWNSMKTAEGAIAWTANKDEATALLDDGKTAEVRLKRFAGMTDEPVVIRNLRYWGAPRNDGFVLMPNTVEAVRAGDQQFEFKGTNGFMITVDIDSDTAPPAAGS